ncbi:tetratricopeptide repeat protein [Aquimarina celericrescens]|uniref:Tetratricopeptide repeat protein n=1 Tax=Aquimarina celericrescens TaxID=1964542 RepID=A0ABW5AVN1_9FLAO|nr:CHAT domain-containing protein [Aquimarina celericrescens]
MSDYYLPNENIEKAFAYDNIGTVLFFQRKYDENISFYLKSLKIRKEKFGKDHPIIFQSYFNLGLTYYRKEKYDKALFYLFKSISDQAIKSNIKEKSIAKSNEVIGDVYRAKGEFSQAINYYEKGLGVFKKNPGAYDNEVLRMLGRIGICYKRKGEYDIALDYYQKAITISERNNISSGNLHNNVGVVYKYKGEYDRALLYLKKGLRINLIIYGKNHPYVALNYNNIGNIYRLKRNIDESLRYYEKAIKIRLGVLNKNHSDIAYSYNDIGILYQIQKKYNKSLTYLMQSLMIRKNLFGGNHPEIADSFENLAMVYFNKDDSMLALQNHQKSLKIRLKIFGKRHPKIALSHNKIAQVHFKKSDFKKALINYEKAINTNLIPNTENKSFNYNILLSSIQGQAKTYEALYKQNSNINNLNQAINTYQKADTIINQIRQSFTNYQDKVTFAKTAKEIYQGAIAVQLLQYKIEKNPKLLEQAFYYAERSKANTLKELLNDANAKAFAGLPNEVVELEKELRIDQAFYRSQITKELSSKKTDSVKVTNYESRLFDISRRQDSLIEVLEKDYPKYHQLKHKNKISTVAAIQNKLAKNKTVIEFFTSDSSTYAFTLSKERLAVREMVTPKLKEKIEDFRKTITSKNLTKYKENAHDLYQQLMAPIADQLAGDELIIIPDGPLWYLNFDLLLTQNNASNNPKELSYLLKDYAITYANSVNLLFNSTPTNQEIQQREECLAFSFSDSTNVIDSQSMSLATLRDAGDDLPGTRKEIRAISEIIDGQYYYGSEAIESNFKKNASRYSILHLALHGEVDNDRPENSRLYFTKTKDTLEDNFLYGHELFALDIPAELTVLSACNTGTGKIAKGEGIMSLGSAFQYAGTKSLLLSSWEVSDQTTPELMKYFYRNLKEGMNKAKALQQAKLQYLQTANINRIHPFYWGGFYLVGDTAPIQFTNDLTLYWVLGALLLLVLLGGVFWYRRNPR